MTLQIFLHFFHHKFVTSLQSTSLPSATSALSLQRIGDALLPPTRPRSADLIAYCSSGGTRPRERSRFQLTPDSVGGTRTDADAPRTRRR